MSIMLSGVYLVYFRKDGQVIQNITKILKGLNSNTFNYLESHSENLRLTKLLNNYNFAISSNQFMDDCMRINKPCKFENHAKNWTAYDKWHFGEQGYSYLKDKFYDQHLKVFVNPNSANEIDISRSEGDSFDRDYMQTMPYEQFLTLMNENPQGVSLRDSSDKTFKKLKEDVTNPQFLSQIAEFTGIEILQGQTFLRRGHYDQYEQVMCSIDGIIQIKLIPHIFRQEVYSGQDKITYPKESQDTSEQSSSLPQIKNLPVYESPVNFFDPDLETYPLFNEIDRKYTVILHEGDCLYIPAFYFFQYQGKPTSQPADANGQKPGTLALALKYENNSEILKSFMIAVEEGVLK